MIKAQSIHVLHLALIRITLTLVSICYFSITVFSQEKEKGINIGIVYPLSIQGIHSKDYANIFSLHAFAGLSREEKGFTASGFTNIVKENATGFQVAGFLNKIGGTADGFKGAGFLNIYKDAKGFQTAGFANFSKGDIQGMQGAGFINLAHDIKGFQGAGYINIADSVYGAQGAGFINIAGDVEGAQIAGFINIAKKVKGVQAAGFINIADSSEYPIGLINIVRNGEKYLGVTTDDNLTTLLAFRSGSRKLYGIIGLGYNSKNKEEEFALQYGLGAHLLTRNKFRLNAEGTITHLEDFKKGEFVKTSLSILPALKLGNRIEIFGGPSLNYVSTTSADGRNLIDHYMLKRTSRHDENRLYGMYIGYTAGLHLSF
jgi:hypothetical protein